MLDYDKIRQIASDATESFTDRLLNTWPYKPAYKEGFTDGALWAQKQLQAEIDQLRQKLAEYEQSQKRRLGN